MDVRLRLWRKLSAEELMLWTVVLEKTLESPLDCKEIQPIHSEDQSWDFFGANDVDAETPVLWPPHVKSWLFGKDWCWAGLGAGGEGDDRGWDGWMASLTRWTWVWVNSGSWWWIGRPGVLRFMGSQRVGHDSVTELNWKLKIMIQVMWAAACIKYFNLKIGLIHTLCWLSLTTDSVNICWVTLIPFLGKWVTLLYGY